MSKVMPPDEIREIRKALGLTQAEAGAVLGGGPRAFAKYEAGTVGPSAGLVKLLRLLESEPSMLGALGARRSGGASPATRDAPFSVLGEDVAGLREWEMPGFLRSLLHAEAEVNGLPADGIHVAEDYFVADGGEDANIRWAGGIDRTAHLPGRYTQFQIKAGVVTPSKAGRDVLARNGDLKDMVRSALEEGAHYVLLCTTSLTAKKAKALADEIRKSLRGAGLPIGSERIHVRDADQVAAWVNEYPAITVRLKERTRPGSTGPFRSWVQWADRSEHALSPLVDDSRLPPLRTRLAGDLGRAGTVVRVLGAAGVGKSRLVLESLCSAGPQGLPMNEFVLYADQSEAGETTVSRAAMTLADAGARAVVVVDDCPTETHQRLARMVAGSRSRLSLLTIDNDEAYGPGARHDPTVQLVDLAPQAVTEAIVDRKLPGLPPEDRRRLLLFSRGFPAVAVRVAEAWMDGRPMAYSAEAHFVDAFLTGRNDAEPALTIRTAMLIAAFGTVRVDPPERSQVAEIAGWGRRLTAGDMHAALERLLARGVVQRRGGLVVLQPRPVAMQLTERQWLEWPPDRWSELLAGDARAELRSNAARQLAWTNDTEVAKRVAAAVLRPGGPLDGIEHLRRPGNAAVVYRLAAIDAHQVVDCIRRSFDDVADLRTVRGEPRRELVEALERTAFPADTFDESAWLMLRLAVAETEDHIANNATGQLAAMFPMLEGATAATGESRVAFLRDAADTDDARQRAVVVGALLAGAGTAHTFRFVGAESHGSRPALKPWRPANAEQEAVYVSACVDMLAAEAIRADEVGAAARAGLGHELRALVWSGLVDTVETVVTQVQRAVGTWPEAIESMGNFVELDAAAGVPDDVVGRVRALIELLQPRSLSERIRDLVSDMPWDYPNGEVLDPDEQTVRQLGTVKQVAAEALGVPTVLADHIPQLCRGAQRWAGAFGEFLGARIDSPDVWLKRIEAALGKTPEDERNFDLLAGYLEGLCGRDAGVVSAFKRRAAESRDLAPALPAVCRRLGVAESDVRLAVDALRSGRLPAWPLRQWAFGSVLDKLPTDAVALLLEVLQGHGSDGLLVAMEMLGMLARYAPGRLDGLSTLVAALAGSVVQSGLPRADENRIRHHLDAVFNPVLERGRGDEDARTLALTLARGLADPDASQDTVDLLSPFLPILLAGFPEIAWPLIGQQVVRHTASAWRLRNKLRGTFASRGSASRPPILSLPPDTLFAWCSAHPDEAPVCAARMLPLLQSDAGGSTLHPLYRRLLDQFGDREDVLEGARASIFTFSWVGSLVDYFARHLRPLQALRDHPVPRVARWAKRTGRQLEQEIERVKSRDYEREAGSEV